MYKWELHGWYKRHGLVKSKEYDLDPDEVNQGEIPIKAHCQLANLVTPDRCGS